MKTIRKDWPKVRQYVKSGNTYFHVDLRRKHYQGPKWKNFTDRDTALKYAAEIGEKVAKDGLSSISMDCAILRDGVGRGPLLLNVTPLCLGYCPR